MATCKLQQWTGSLDSKGQDSIVEEYLIEADAIHYSPYDVLAIGQSSGPNPLPPRGARYSTTSHLFARTFRIAPTREHRSAYMAEVTFAIPEDPTEQGNNTNPLLRPAVFNVEYVDSQYIVTKAKNVEGLLHGDGKGGNRAALTLGPIVNAAGKQLIEPVMDNERNGVLVIYKNYASLDAIVTMNETYARTTNILTYKGFDVRRLKYQVTESQGVQVENDIIFWPGVTRVEIKTTTDISVDNVGYQEWSTISSAFRPLMVEEAEPKALDLDGSFSAATGNTSITYRHLTEVDYSPLG